MGSCNGPVFIIGMPRSGTKLLRSLLNNHSQIAITTYESGLIPFFYKNFSNYGDVKIKNNFHKFYQKFSQTTFFTRLTKDDAFINEDLWFKDILDGSFPEVIEVFYTIYAQSRNKNIWGDKTPSYIYEIPLLSRLFPQAKFVHIIRDVRDYSLSVKKAWNKNIFRASQRWTDAIEGCRRDVEKSKVEAYLEIKYEHLISHPESTLTSVCDFLHIPYEKDMNKLIKSPENLAATKGIKNIVTDNSGKWKTQMKASTILKIEANCGRLLNNLGYPLTYPEVAPKRLGRFEMLLYKVNDALQVILFEIKKGSVNNIYDSLRAILARKNNR